ncbi:MAG: DEAD/DEAH box helicase [Candidatus Nanosalina sp.]
MVEDITVEDVSRILDGSIEPRDQQIMNSAAMIENPQQDFVNRQPVGTGKTEQAMMAMAGKAQQMNSQGEDYRAAVVLPSNSLVRQWDERFEEHGLNELFDVRVNKRKDEFSNWGEVNAMPDSMGTKKSNAIRQEDRDFKKHKERVYGSHATPFSDTDELWHGHNIEGQEGADIVLTTHHLLKSDIENDRVDLDQFNVDDIFVDEATAFVARQKEANEEDTFYGGHRVAKNFEELVDEMYEDSRFVGLTALPGRKLHPLLDYLGAELISPPQESLEVSMAEVEAYTHEIEENLMVDDPLSRPDEDEKIGYTESVLRSMFSELDDRREQFKYAVINNTDKTIDQDANVFGYVGHSIEEIDEEARNVLRMENDIQRVYEGAVETFKDDLPAGYTDPKMEAVAEMTSEWNQTGENYVLFASHKDTAEYIGEMADAEVVTGDYTDESNESVLEEFGTGVNGVVMTYDYGAEGIDLPEGDHVVHMTDRINPQLKQSATGRAKRGSDIEEHTLLYESEDSSDREAIDYGEDSVPVSDQSTRNRLRKMLGQTESELHDMIQSRTMRGADEKYGHVLNTPPRSDRSDRNLSTGKNTGKRV